MMSDKTNQIDSKAIQSTELRRSEVYMERFNALVDARVYIKHGDYDSAKALLCKAFDTPENANIFDEYLNDSSKAKALADALKTTINSVYGLTSASFPNLDYEKFRGILVDLLFERPLSPVEK